MNDEGLMDFPELRTESAEDAYVAFWGELEEPEGLMEAVSEAMRRRRPQLAIRLLGLLDEEARAEAGADVADLMQRTRLFLVSAKPYEDENWAILEQLTGRLKERVLTRCRSRARNSLRADASDMLGLCRGTRRRRR
jgi:hypothetical protein